jgi:hypothetical protein
VLNESLVMKAKVTMVLESLTFLPRNNAGIWISFGFSL